MGRDKIASVIIMTDMFIIYKLKMLYRQLLTALFFFFCLRDYGGGRWACVDEIVAGNPERALQC